MESLNESEKTFTTVILGGGPETLVLLLEALKHSKIHEFLKKDGLAIIEKSTSFGSGYMDNFVVKSTKSSALSFIKLLLKHPEVDEQNKKLMEMIEKGKIDESISMIVSTIKNIANFPKIYEFCSPMFRELLETNVFVKLMQDNLNPSLLIETGYFLKLLGNSFLNHLKVIKNAEIFVPRREVVSLRLLIDGMILVTSRIIEDNDAKKSIIGVKNAERFESYRTKRVILTSPGGPRVQPPQNIIPLEKLIDADGFLQESGYARVYSLLTKQSKKKVLILGANPTAFACISLLLKGPEQSDCYEESVNRNGVLLSKRQKVFEREKIAVNELNTQSDTLSQSSKVSAMSSKRSTGIIPAEVNTPPKKKCHGNHHHKEHEHSPQIKNESTEEAKFQQFLKFTKYGSIKGTEYNLHKKYPKPLIFDDDNIVLAYKDTPKLYFSNAHEATKAGYKVNSKDVASTGEVNMLDGLTGETQKLYEDIQARTEKRVQLLQANSTADLKDLINEANIIIDCQGFDPELVLIKDVYNQPLKIRKGPNGGYLVDGHGRIVSEKGVIRGIYTLGLGFETEEGDKGRVMDPYTRFSKYDNYEHLQRAIFKDSLLESLAQDLKSLEDNDEHYENLTKDKGGDPFKIEEKKSGKFGFDNMESVIMESEMPMYTTLRMFEKMNFDKAQHKHGHNCMKDH